MSNTTELYRTLAQNLPNTGIVMFDRDMRYTFAEGLVIKEMLPKGETMVGQLPHEVLPSDMLKFLLPVYQRILVGESFSFEQNLPDFTFMSYASPINDEAGQIIGGMILTHDVSEAKHTKAALHASETRFHSLVDLAPVGIIQTDAAGKRVFCNTRWCEMTGLSLEQALNDVDSRTIHPEDREVASIPWNVMMANQLPFENAIFRYQRPDGTEVWVSGNGRPLYDEQGVITGYLGIVTNIDLQVRTQATLRESESRYRSVIDTMSEGVVMQGRDGTIQACNPAAERIVGLTAEQMMGRTSFDSLWRAVHEDGTPFPVETRPAVVTLRTGQSLSNIIMGVYNPDDSLRWVSTNSQPIFTNDSPLPSSVVITFTDITEVRGAQVKLRQERDLLRTLIDNTPDYIFLKDKEGRFILSNAAHAQAAGNLAPDGLIGKTAFDVFPSELASQFHADDLALMESGESLINAERQTVDPQGNNKIVLTTKIPWRDSSGQILGLVGISRDITERNRMENLLRQNEERLRIITDNSLDLIAQTDLEGRFVFVSPSYRTILGYEPEWLLGMNSLELVHADDHIRMVQTATTAIESSTRQFVLEFRLRHADGHYINVETVGTLLFDNESKYAGGVFISRDITERKRMENLLRQNEERLRLITNNIQDLVTLGDAKGKLVFVNPSSRTLLGYEPESLLDMPSTELFHPDDRLLMTDAFQTGFETGRQHFTVEGRLRHADGYYVWTESSITYLFDNQSTFTGGVFVARDISERKIIQAMTIEQEKLQVELDKELELSTLKTRMMQRIAHEFRTPLTIVQTSVEILTKYLDRLTPDQRATRFDSITSQIESITDMLLQIGLAINGSFKPDEIKCDATDVSALCRQLAVELEAQLNRPGKFVLDLPSRAVISADVQVLKDAFLHVMRNAVRFSEASSVVKVSLIQLEKGIELRVTDSGIGILPDEQSHIFEPFFRGSNINEVGGLGIGLTIVHAAIEAHEGTVTVESVPKQGTTVTIRIP